ncbi:hemopexin [Rhincodon typus]|uniref:hemopexin n=1 Tax=Rhincodon typus TaxID=259920 RepID=UPI0020307ECF|nr:hemopexin [Rhincodon typus]
MKFLLGGLCLFWAVALSFCYPWLKHRPNITEDELNQHHSHPRHEDEFLWRGFRAAAEFINKTWPGLPDHIDAAFRIHHKISPQHHDRMFFFKGNQVWQYYGTKLEGQFLIQDKFHGIPDNLGAAVECPEGECQHDSVLFFKGATTYLFDLSTNTVKQRPWTGLHHCTAAMRWIERYYCFQGSNFTRFHPHTGMVFENYPKDARNYFMQCEGRGHGNKTADPSIHNRCSNRSFDEFNQDEFGRVYAFRDNCFFDFQGSQIYIYKAEAHYTLIEGYPKSVTEELGIHGTGVDATFICPGTSILYVIRGNQVQSINLEQTPRHLGDGFRIGHSHVDGAMCNTSGTFIFVGTDYYKYCSITELAGWTETPEPHSISADFMSCVQ